MKKILTKCVLLICAALSSTLISCQNEEDFPPIISSVTPLEAGIGDTINITGMRLGNVKFVYFGHIFSTTLLSQTNTTLSTIVPENAVLGNQKLVLGKSVDDAYYIFNVIGPVPAPFISGAQPEEGAVGTVIKIYGSDFSNVIKVAFGNIKTCVCAITDSSITTVVPEGLLSGSVTISVTTPHGMAKQKFTVL